MDSVEWPNGVVINFPQGVDETSFTRTKEFPLGSKLIKGNGQTFYYFLKGNKGDKVMEKFWECYVEGTSGGQHYKHYSLEEAQAEAERLARKEEGKTVYLFECVGKCRVEPLPIKWEVPR